MDLPSPRTPDHVEVMDGLRALAIAWVVALHIWQLSWLRLDAFVLGWQLNFNHLAETGFSGVELFFFVSGFCLFYPYARARLEDRPWPGLRHYAYRRAIKILPSYWLAIIAILLYKRPDWLHDPAAVAWNLGSHLFFVQNIFHDTESSINGVFWSLGVEVQFYVLFPLFAWAFVKRPALTYGLMCAFAICWRAFVQDGYHDDFRFLMDQLPGYLDLFANGMLAAMVIAWVRLKPEGHWAFKTAATGVAIASLYAVSELARDLWVSRIGQPDWPWAWQVDHRYHLALAFLAIAVFSARALQSWKGLLAAPALAFLSTISYNLYIWHQVVGRELVAWKMPPYNSADPHGDPVWAFWFTLNAIALSIALAALITYAFERPLLKRGIRSIFRRRTAPEPETPATRAA